MSDQDFGERMLSAIDDLKRTIERMDDRTDKRLAAVEKDVSEFRIEVKRTIERIDEKIDNRFTTVGKDVGELRGDVRDEIGELRGDVRWIRGKLEGRQEATSNKDAKTALWIALGSALAAIVSLIKSFWN